MYIYRRDQKVTKHMPTVFIDRLLNVLLQDKIKKKKKEDLFIFILTNIYIDTMFFALG